MITKYDNRIGRHYSFLIVERTNVIIVHRNGKSSLNISILFTFDILNK